MSLIFVIGGYSRSGKTTALNYLKDKGLNIVSTSAILHELTARYVKSTLKSDFANPDLALSVISRILETHKDEACFMGKSGRELKISVAEEIVVPTLGRISLVNAAVERLTPFSILESIGGEEYMIAQKAIIDRGFCIRRYNIVRASQLTGVDIRQPLPDAVEIVNDGTLEDLYCKLEQHITAHVYTGVFYEKTKR